MIWFRNRILNRLPFVGYRRHRGLALPPRSLRTGGLHFREDANYLASADAEATRLARDLGLDDTIRILDLGCGAGRLAIGLRSTRAPFAHYHGIDVDSRRIAWCAMHVGGGDPRFEFEAVDVANDRYNPGGASLRASSLSFYRRTYDVIYLYSVFSHLMTDAVEVYLEAFAHSLSPSGRIFLTVFVEDGVPDCEENPHGYGKLKWEGPLHCVRFRREFFEAKVAAAGLEIVDFVHGRETDGQSAYRLKHRTT